MKDYDGFIYCWVDKKYDYKYIGSHYGKEEDGYICSSGRMLRAFKKRPKDFEREILYYHQGSHKELLEKEDTFLESIDDSELGWRKNEINGTMKYYNLKKKGSGLDSDTAKKLKKEWWDSSESEDWRNTLSENMKGNKYGEGKIPWNKGKKCPEISESLKGRKMTDEQIEKNRQAMHMRWERGDFDNRPKPSKETRKKMSEAQKGKKQTEHQKKRAREANLGKKAKESTREKLREIARERAKKVLTCPHCNLSGNGPVMYRFHFKNCNQNI